MTTEVDNDEDLGEEVTSEQAEKAERVAEQARGADGKFVKNNDGEESAEGDELEVEETVEPPAKAKTKVKTKEKKEPEGETEEEVEEEGEEETEEEDEEEPEEADEEEEEAAPAPKKNRLQDRVRKVTHQRNAALERLDFAERELAVLKAGTMTKKEQSEADKINADLDELYVEVEKLRADAKYEDAAKVQRQIDARNRRLTTIESSAAGETAALKVTQGVAYDSMLDVLESKFSVIRPKSKDFDSKVVEELNFQVQAYEKMGMTSTAALRRAALLFFQEDPFGKAPAATVPEKKSPLRKGVDVKKNLDAQRRTLPSGGKGPAPLNVKKDYSKMSDADIAKLPKEEQDEIFGNTFTPTDD